MALAYRGTTCIGRDEIVDIGPLQATADTQETIPFSALLGGLALVAGITLVLVGAKES